MHDRNISSRAESISQSQFSSRNLADINIFSSKHRCSSVKPQRAASRAEDSVGGYVIPITAPSLHYIMCLLGANGHIMLCSLCADWKERSFCSLLASDDACKPQVVSRSPAELFHHNHSQLCFWDATPNAG